MLAPASPVLLEAVAARRQQLGIRFFIGAAIAVALGPLIGWPFVAAWLAAWYAIQGAEWRWSASVARRAAAAEPVAALPALAFAFATSLVFNLVAMAAIFTGNTWMMICGIWILAGSLLNAVSMSRASNGMFLAGSAGTLLCCMALLAQAYRAHASPAEYVALGLGAGLMVLAALVLRGVGLQALRAAERASAAKSIFLANMSHEIRTPLNGVLGMAHVMATGDLAPAQRAQLEVIAKSGKALLALLNDILDLSKVETGRLELEMGRVDVEEIARELGQAFAAACAGAEVAIGIEVEPSARGAWRGDPVRVRQIVSNLLSNAVKFTERGRIDISIATHDGGLTLSVADTGVGIAPDRLGSIFDKFVQANASTTRRYGGTGLGLSICRELAELMGGSVTAQSTPGQGSTFTVRLPLDRCEAVADGDATTEAAERSQRPLRILAAEDHETNQAVLRVLLDQLGLSVHIVGDGAQAVAAWDAEPWDLVLMDVQMPVMDGPTAVAAIRAREAASGRARTPILALTANAMTHHVADYLACGMDGFVPKPIELATLTRAIDKALDASPSSAQAVA